MSKFEVGDIVKGISSSRYRITTDKMTKGEVTAVRSNGTFGVRILEHKDRDYIGRKFDSLKFEHFDYVRPENVGDRVVCINGGSWSRPIVGKKGTVRFVSEHSFGIEFDEYMDGHGGGEVWNGKYGHCWNLDKDYCKLIAGVASSTKMETKPEKKDKFNVGDRVRIVSKKIGNFWNFDGRMDKWLGQTMTIDGVEDGYYLMKEDHGECKWQRNNGWKWYPHMIVGLAPMQKILITVDGRTTLARLYEGEKVIKKAETRCNPTDDFRFIFGALHAFNRLLGLENKCDNKKLVSGIKVGDRVKATAFAPLDKEGKVIKINNEGVSCDILVEFDDWMNGHDGGDVGRDGRCWWCFAKHLKLLPSNNKILITTDGCTTFAKLYDGNKLIKSAEAKYNPADSATFPFNFAEGAGWAFEKLTGLPVQHKNISAPKEKKEEPVPQFTWEAFRTGKIAVHFDGNRKNAEAFLVKCHQHGIKWAGGDPCSEDKTCGFDKQSCYACNTDGLQHAGIDYWAGKEIVAYPFDEIQPVKHVYKIGDKAKIIGNTSASPFRVGEIVELYEKASLGWRCRNSRLNRDFGNYVRESDMEPYAEPASVAEPIKMYCIKDYKSCDSLTKGKVYTINPDGSFVLNGGRVYNFGYKSFADFKRENADYAACLVPLIKRPAKEGEWVYVLHTSYSDELLPGDISQVISVGFDGRAKIAKHRNLYPDGLCYLQSWYLVLDGYQAEEPAAPSFSWENFRKNKIAVYCDSENKAKAFLKEADAHGFSWSSDDSLLRHTNWFEYEDQTCYSGEVCYCNKSYYEREGYTIVEYPFAKVTEPVYKAGDKVRIVAAKSGHRFPIGKIVRLVEYRQRSSDWKAEYLDGHDFWIITKDEIEPYQEKKQESIKLYCTKNAGGSYQIKKGEVYEFDAEGRFHYSGGEVGGKHESLADYFKYNNGFAKCLVPLVQRRAEVGEWILLTNDISPYHYPSCKVGEVVKIDFLYHDKAASNRGNNWDVKEYLVLEGYQPDEQQEMAS